LENVSIPLHLRGWKRKRIEERAKELLSLVKLGARMNHRPDELSGGERPAGRNRESAFGVSADSASDEPTGNLDSQTAADILSLIRALNKDLNATVVMVTHDREIAESCPRTIGIRDGSVVEDSRR